MKCIIKSVSDTSSIYLLIEHIQLFHTKYFTSIDDKTELE